MSRPQNFLEADSNFRDQNLRFVRNNLEDNINQFFGGGGGGVGGNGRPNNGAPPRNFKIVQPSPELEQRREFFLQLGLSRSEADSLSNRSFCSEQFNINYFKDKRHQLRKSRLKQTDADAKIVNEISVTIAELERQASNFGGGGGFNDRRVGGNFSGGFNGGNHGVFNGPRGFDGRGGGNPENLNSIGKSVSGIFVGSGSGNFDGRGGVGAGNLSGRGIGFPENLDVRGGGFHGNLTNRSGDGLGLLDSRGSNGNRNLGDRAFDDRRGSAGNFDGRNAAPGIWDNKRGGGQQNINRNFIGELDSGPRNFGNRGDGPGNFSNMGDGGSGNFGNMRDGPGNFGNRDNCGPENFGSMGGGGPGNFGNRGDGPRNFSNMGDGGPGNFGNRGDGPRNFGNMGDCGPENFGNRADGNHGNVDQRWNGDPKNFNTRGDGPTGQFVGGPRGFDNNDGGRSRVFDNRSGGGTRGFDGREGTGSDNFDNRRHNGNSTFGDQSRFDEVGIRRNDSREGFEESFKRRAPTPPRNINWNERKRQFPGDVNDGPPSSVFRNERNMNEIPRQLNLDDFNRRRSPQPNMNQSDFDQFGGGNNNRGNVSNNQLPFAPNNRAPHIFNSKDQNFDRDPGRVGNIGKQNMPLSFGGLIYANNMNRNESNNANKRPISVGNASIGRGNNGNPPNTKGNLRSGNNLNSTATSGNVADRSRNKVNQNPPNRSGAQSNNKGNPNDHDQSKRAAVANNSNKNKASLNTGANLNRNIQNQPNNSNMNSQRRNISQNSNIKPNSSQSIGNVERGSRKPSNNIPSLLNNNNIFGFGNRGINDNFNNNNAPFPGNNNFNNFEPMNADGYQSNTGDIDFVSLLTTLASTTSLTKIGDSAANLKNVVASRVRRRRRARSGRDKVDQEVTPTSVNLANLVNKKDVEWPFKVQRRSTKKTEELPQSLKESFAVHFFSKRLPKKSGGSSKSEPQPDSTTDCGTIWLDDKSDIDSDNEEAADEGITYKIPIPIQIRTTKKDWRRFDKSENKDEIWLKWWQEYKSYEPKIRGKLDEFKGQLIKAAISYTPPKNCANPKWQIQNKYNQVLRYLLGQGGDSYLIAKYFYLLKDQQFWKMLSEEQMSNILLGIQNFKNASWLDFQRGLVLTWVYLDEMINFEKKTDGVMTAAHKKICKRAKILFQNGIFHWMVKEAHFDLKVNTNEKYFVNVCQTDEIPAPEDLTEEQLSEILSSEQPSNYRIPMSISEPRTTKDKSNNVVEVCDIAVNPKFFVKCKKSTLFKDFFLALIAEALSEKYNVQISIEKTIVLATRKFIGSLVSHRVRNNDVQKVLQSYQTPTEDDRAKLEHLKQSATSGIQQQRLVQEIDDQEISSEQLRTDNAERAKKETIEPLYKLRAKIRDEKVDEIHAEFYLPKCITSQEITLDIGEDRILMESMKHGYMFDKFVNYRLNQQRARAIYDKTNKMLQLRIPVLAAE